MSASEVRIHTCDRCGDVRQQPIRQDRPAGWTVVSQQRVPGGALAHWDLCGSCSKAFEFWVDRPVRAEDPA